MSRRHTVPAVLLLSLVAITGCNNVSTASDPQPSSSTSSASPSGTLTSASAKPTDTPSGSPTVDPSSAREPARLPTSRIEAASLHLAVLGQNAAKTAGERAVVDTWMTYWQGAADTYYYYRPTPGFDRVARSTARSAVVAYMGRLKSDKQRVVGWARDNVTEVKVEGDTATVRDCTRNFTFTVDEEIEPLTHPDPYYEVTGTLEKSGDAWTVTRQTSTPLRKSCLY